MRYGQNWVGKHRKTGLKFGAMTYEVLQFFSKLDKNMTQKEVSLTLARSWAVQWVKKPFFSFLGRLGRRPPQ